MKMTREIGLSKQFSFDNIKSYFQTPEDLRGRSTTDSGRTDTGGSTNSSTAGSTSNSRDASPAVFVRKAAPTSNYKQHKNGQNVAHQNRPVQGVQPMRQLPCRTHISCGTCPYGDRCVFLHDPRLEGPPLDIDAPRALRGRKEAPAGADAFFWFTMPMASVSKRLDRRGRPDIAQEYVVPEPDALMASQSQANNRQKPPLAKHFKKGDASVAPPPISCQNPRAASTVYSTWQHFLDFLSCSVNAQLKEEEDSIVNPMHPILSVSDMTASEDTSSLHAMFTSGSNSTTPSLYQEEFQDSRHYGIAFESSLEGGLGLDMGYDESDGVGGDIFVDRAPLSFNDWPLQSEGKNWEAVEAEEEEELHDPVNRHTGRSRLPFFVALSSSVQEKKWDQDQDEESHYLPRGLL